MATDDADRRAAEVVASFEGCAACMPPDMARAAIAAAIRAAVDAYRQRVCAVLADALPGAADLLRREGGK